MYNHPKYWELLTVPSCTAFLHDGLSYFPTNSKSCGSSGCRHLHLQLEFCASCLGAGSEVVGYWVICWLKICSVIFATDEKTFLDASQLIFLLILSIVAIPGLAVQMCGQSYKITRYTFLIKLPEEHFLCCHLWQPSQRSASWHGLTSLLQKMQGYCGALQPCWSIWCLWWRAGGWWSDLKSRPFYLVMMRNVACVSLTHEKCDMCQSVQLKMRNVTCVRQNPYIHEMTCLIDSIQMYTFWWVALGEMPLGELLYGRVAGGPFWLMVLFP